MPDYVFEASWEVCNKVGGIYTVLSTRARVLQERLHDNMIFIGPDVWSNQQCHYFAEEPSLLLPWRERAEQQGLHLRIGRWQVPGRPIAVLVDFRPFFSQKNSIYTQLWEDYQVDSLHAYGDYDESSMFAYAAAKIVESYYNHYLKGTPARVVFHANEWMTGLAALYINKNLPQIATIFTTHATSVGRSICGNRKPLYQYLHAYNGDQMAFELNLQSKHSVEKKTAHYVDCFTTVSDITAQECSVLLEKTPDIVLPNGFDDDFVPKGRTYTSKRVAARTALLRIANCLTGKIYPPDTLIVATSGRYEFLNKGIDLFISSLASLNHDGRLGREVVAFVEVPGWVKEPRADLRARLQSREIFHDSLQYPQLTHWLHNHHDDCVCGLCAQLDMWNRPSDHVTIIFIPCYLTGADGILNLEYYDALLANDICVFPSYYEPWGYTPLEAIAFSVPCITTDLAGFGLWVDKVLGKEADITDGVKVLHRTDYNYAEVLTGIRDTIIDFSQLSPSDVQITRQNAAKLSKKALWKNFIAHYLTAYDFALRRASERLANKSKPTNINNK